MNYQQIYPTDPLRKHVCYFWMLEDDSLEFSDKTAPYTKNGSANLEKCLGILSEWGVANNHHKIFDQFQEAVRRGRVGDVIPSRFS
ncbi:hypothetical protein SAMN05660841_02509 [Sphingobacterium nematocida]|uniref:Uncharacterized protein n=1 Tax=Sphingobacterium nematocida TaxID=1513896 RepID=A0A1T5EEQ1_9SPHI|nr:hypothetical protein [Sphingobacterium nematocida]SKB82245.1 hypothetical protein SAMN05660841_02509 [Sphingobacterium nematocida]